MTPSPSAACPQCGAVIPEASEHGLCPRCVFAKAMQPTAETGTSSPVPPDLDAIRAAFPFLEVISLIGSGGMGSVFKARQPQLDRFVALKILPSALAEQPGFSERFQREAQALAKLSHPHIVTVHDFGQAGGFYYLLMEFVDGVNLRQLLQAKKLTPKEALSIVPPVCDALQCAHDRGIVHRDIKPENLLIDKAGVVKIADFGIAKIVGHDTGAPTRGESAQSGVSGSLPLGTPDYAAPEQANGTSDHRADIYSLGVVLYEMLTGERPKGKIEAPSKRVQVDIRIDEIVLRALEKTPELRYQTAVEFRTQVETVTVENGRKPSSRAGERDPFRGSHALPLWLRLILGAISVVCLLNFAGPHITRLGNQPARTFTVGLSAPWLVVHPQYVNETRYVHALKWNFRSSSFRSGIVALAIAATLVLSRRNVRLRLRWLAGARSEANVPTAVRAELSGPPRLSRLAVFGACWVPVTVLSFVAAAVASYQRPGGPAAGPEWWQLAVLIPAMILGVAGPFGTTILGWLAVSQIRRSAGRIHGLQLALFDGLVFPLMTLSAVIAMSGAALAKMVVDFYANPSAAGHAHVSLVTRMANWLSLNKEVAVFVGVVAAIVVNVLIVRAVMRAVRKGIPSTPSETGATSNEIRVASIALILALFGTALGALAAIRSAGARPAMALSLMFAGMAIFMGLPSRRLAAGKSALIVAALGMVIWPLVAFVFHLRQPVGLAKPSGIEKIKVTEDRAMINQPRYNLEGMIITFGPAANRWTPSGVYLEAMFDVTLEPHLLGGGANWVMKTRHGIHSGYRLDGPPGPMLGKVVFHPGTPAPDTDGAYVVGEFRPEKGEPLPIAVRLENDKRSSSFPTGAHISREHRSVLVAHDQQAVTLHYVLFYEGDFANTSSSGPQNAATNTWTDKGSVKLKNGRSFGYRREALYPDELHINGTRYDLSQGRVIVLHDDGIAEQLRLFPAVNIARDPEAMSQLIRSGKAEPEQKSVAQKPATTTIPDHIDFKVTRVETWPDARTIVLRFERGDAYGLGIEFSQDVIAGPGEKMPQAGYRDFRSKTFLGVNGARAFSWKLPDDFSPVETQVIAKELDHTARQMTQLADGALIEFARAKHREGWTYVLLARVRREPGAPHPPAPPGAIYAVEKQVIVPGDFTVGLKLLASANSGAPQIVGEPLLFKTPRDRATGFLLRWHAYDAGGANPAQPSRVLVDLVDPDTGVIYHRFEHGFGMGVRFQVADAAPLPGRNPSVILDEPGRSTRLHLLAVEKVVPPGAAIADQWQLLADIRNIRGDEADAPPLFQMPSANGTQPAAPAQETQEEPKLHIVPIGKSNDPAAANQTRTFALHYQLARNMEVALRQVFRDRIDSKAKAASDDRTIVVTAPPEVMTRVRTFIAVNDATDTLAREEPHGFPRQTPLVAVRAFLHACAAEEEDAVISDMLSVGVLAELRGEQSKEFEEYQTTGVADLAWESELRGDWSEKSAKLRELVREWNRHPLTGITAAYEEGATPKPAAAALFADAPEALHYMHVVPESFGADAARITKGVLAPAYLIDSLPPWWPNPTARRALTQDEEKQFQARQFPKPSKP